MLKPDEATKSPEDVVEKQQDPEHLKPDYCGSCYGAETEPNECCNTCDEVRLAYRNKGWALDSLKQIEQVLVRETSPAMLADVGGRSVFVRVRPTRPSRRPLRTVKGVARAALW